VGNPAPATLYVWTTGTAREQAFAVVHCTLGDLLIALSALTLALVFAGDPDWPRQRFWQVAILTIVFGAGYTVFSEWLNVVVRASDSAWPSGCRHCCSGSWCRPRPS
jgi:hypothetical protein